ncbi:MAG: zinc ribbon domain-containing protein [Gemmatimonadota bacterium]
MIWEAVAAALLGVAIIWLVLQPLVRPGAPRPSIYVPPDPEETRRGVAIAALKEIEFDRETGKLSDIDYAYLKARYTGEALDALRADEATAAGSDIEALIAARTRSLAGGTPMCATCGPRPEADAAFCSTCGVRIASAYDCSRCGAAVPADGRFCEQCGTGVAA